MNAVIGNTGPSPLKTIRIIFFGSSTFSLPILSALLSSTYSVVQVVTTPDRRKGRGQKVLPSVVKIFAQEKGLPLVDPEKLSEPKIAETTRKLEPDFIVIGSYGKIVPHAIFKSPQVAALNVHPSLLPKYRGASPIQQAIIEGDSVTGVSIAEVTDQLDAGDLFGHVSTKIDEHENALELSSRLAQLAGTLLLGVLEKFLSKTVGRTPQDGSEATYAKKLDKGFGNIHWTKSVLEIHNQIRACVPWPSAFTSLYGKRVKIIKSDFLKEDARGEHKAGSIVDIVPNNGIHVQTGSGILILKQMQLEGRREMDGYQFALGQRLSKGDRFGGS